MRGIAGSQESSILAPVRSRAQGSLHTDAAKQGDWGKYSSSDAIPLKKEETGKVYAGLPLGVEVQLPFSLNAQFDPDTARRGIQHVKLNEWLFRRVAELVVATSLHLAAHEPAVAWRAVALRSEQDVSGDEWVSRQNCQSRCNNANKGGQAADDFN